MQSLNLWWSLEIQYGYQYCILTDWNLFIYLRNELNITLMIIHLWMVVPLTDVIPPPVFACPKQRHIFQSGSVVFNSLFVEFKFIGGVVRVVVVSYFVTYYCVMLARDFVLLDHKTSTNIFMSYIWFCW